MSLTLKEKIYGFLFGTAIGDALGLGTEFMSREEASHRYPGGLRNYSQIIRDAHRSQWEQGEWTNDTELILRFIDSIVEENKVDQTAFARTLKEWFGENPIDLNDQLRWILGCGDYVERPLETAMEMWLKMGRQHASNEALQRCALTGIAERYPERITETICKLTHPSQRCVCTGIIASRITNALVYEDRVIDYDETIDIAMHYDKSVVPYIELTEKPDITALELDDEDTYWYTRRTLACALWTLRHTDSPGEALEAAVDAGGDADTNGALAVGISGLKYGFGKLPGELVETLVGKSRIEKQAEKLYRYVISRSPELEQKA